MAMRNVIVLGGGAQGRVIAQDLARALPETRIRVADVRAPRLSRIPNLEWVEADLSSVETLVRLLREADLGVASGNGKGQIFVRGEVIKTVPEAQIVETLVEEAMRLAEEMEAAGVASGEPTVSTV